MKYTCIYLFLMTTVFSVNADNESITYRRKQGLIVAYHSFDTPKGTIVMEVAKTLNKGDFKVYVSRTNEGHKLLEEPEKHSDLLNQLIRKTVEFERTIQK